MNLKDVLAKAPRQSDSTTNGGSSILHLWEQIASWQHMLSAKKNGESSPYTVRELNNAIIKTKLEIKRRTGD